MQQFDTQEIQMHIDKITDNTHCSLYQLPKSVKLEATGACSLKCNFCYNKQLKINNIRQRMLTVDQFKYAFKFIQKIPTIHEIGFFYLGEAALNPNLPYFYKYAKKYNYRTFLTTNGTISNVILECIPFVDSLKVSWNYTSVNDFCYKTKSSPIIFNTIYNNIKIFKAACNAYNKKLSISTIEDQPKINYQFILSKLQFDTHYWLPLQSHAGLLKTGHEGNIGQCSHIRTTMPCWNLFNCLYIDVDLNIRMCDFVHQPDNILYNINDIDYYYLTPTVIFNRLNHLLGKVPFMCRKCLHSQYNSK